MNISGPEATQEGWGEEEIDANDFAAETMLPRSDLNNFIARVRPLYSKKRIVAFAEHHMIHPAIVLGQLKHRGEVRWQNLVGLHAKVRDIVCSAALCDGWGHLAPRDLT